MRTVKCVIVGDDTVGKTSILISFITDKFPIEYIPTIFDNYSVNMMYEGAPFCITLWDTSGHEDYDCLRSLSYPHADVFILCFSVVNPSSFEHICTKWHPEITKYCPKQHILLVGTKTDLRNDPEIIAQLRYKFKMNPITYEQGFLKALEINATGYVECSALKQFGLRSIFEQVLSTCSTEQLYKIEI